MPFWLLAVASVVATSLLIDRIFLAHAIRDEQQLLTANREIASRGSSYEKTWKLLAGDVYRLSARDPALTDMLKRHEIHVQVSPPAPPLPKAPTFSGMSPASVHVPQSPSR